MDNLNKFTEIVSRVLKIEKVAIHDDLSYDDVLGWDSLAQIELISQFEKTFKINIDSSDMSKMKTIGSIKTVLYNYGVTL